MRAFARQDEGFLFLEKIGMQVGKEITDLFPAAQPDGLQPVPRPPTAQGQRETDDLCIKDRLTFRTTDDGGGRMVLQRHFDRYAPAIIDTRSGNRPRVLRRGR